MSIISTRRTAAIMGAAAAIGAAGLVSAESASAVTRDGWCDKGEFCLYYNSWQLGYGSGSDFRTSLKNYGSSQPTCYEFRSPGAGRGQCIKNNAASFYNRTGHSVRIYYNSSHQGRYLTVKPGDYGNLPSWLKNNNASHKIL